MQPFKIQKVKFQSSKPPRIESARLNEIADSISIKKNETMVSCTKCIQRSVMYYYNRLQSIKYAKYLRYVRTQVIKRVTLGHGM